MSTNLAIARPGDAGEFELSNQGRDALPCTNDEARQAMSFDEGRVAESRTSRPDDAIAQRHLTVQVVFDAGTTVDS